MDTLQQAWPEWQIVKELGTGSFGKVYEIERRDIGGQYKAALKVISIPKDQSEIEELKRQGMDEQSTTAYYRGVVEEIVNEFAIMERLKGNTNIVTYEDHKVVSYEKQLGWDILIRMELLTPLNTYLSAHSLTEADVIRLGIDICKALELCKKQNIIHRDIKPENIFISEYGDFKLGDFGIARTAEKSTMGMSKKGTYTYMAPEVYMGKPYNATVDIYSLGMVLYRLLNDNRAPFLPPAPAPISFSDNENAQMRRLSGEILPPPVHASDALFHVIRRACAFNSAERFSTPEEFRKALEMISNGYAAEMSSVQTAQPQWNVMNANYGNDMQDMEATVSNFAVNSPQPDIRNAEQFLSNPYGSDPQIREYPGQTSDRGKGNNSKKSRKPVIVAVAAAAAVVLLLAVVLVIGGMSAGSGKGDIAKKSNSNQSVFSAGKGSGSSKGSKYSGKALGVQIVPEMLWGTYYLEELDKSSPTEDILSDMKYIKYKFPDKEEEYEISALPYMLQIGRPINPPGIRVGFYVPNPYDGVGPLSNTTYYDEGVLSMTNYPDQDGIEQMKKDFISNYPEKGLEYFKNYMDILNSTFCRVEVCDKNLKNYHITGLCVVDGNKLKVVEPVYDYDTFEMSLGETYLSFDIDFEGRNLKLSANGCEKKFVPRSFSKYSQVNNFSIATGFCYPKDDESAYNEISTIYYYTDQDGGDSSCSLYFADGARINDDDHGLAIEFNEDGTFKISWEKKNVRYNGEEECVDDPTQITGEYIWCDDQGLILSIDGQIYYYTFTQEEYDSTKFSNIETKSLSDDKRATLISTQKDILEELAAALNAAGINVSVNKSNGQVIMDTSVLFGVDDAAVSPEGKAYLDKFIQVYADVIVPYMEKGVVASILVEGHTDTSGSFEYNQELSERRAEAVAEYCVSVRSDLAENMSTAGYSYLYPIYDASGNIDMAASRRVVFGFIMKV